MTSLTYFTIAPGAGGRGGFIRLALAQAGWEYEDKRITFAEWPAVKADQPLKQLPVFAYKGKQYVQSLAILRFIGGESGTYPSGIDRLNVDEIIDTLEEAWVAIPRSKEDLQTLRTEWVNGKLHNSLSFIEKRIAEHGGPFATGKNITIADFFLLGGVMTFESGFLDHVPKDLSAKYPNITATLKAVRESPKIAEFFKTHDC